MDKYAQALKKYEELNTGTATGGIVFFGADWLSEVPVAELATDYELRENVYNRSLRGLNLKDTQAILDTCVFALHPDKVFINIGENDIDCDALSTGEFAEQYEWLLYTIHSKCNCSIYILPIMAEDAGNLNDMLRKLAKQHGCTYIELQRGEDSLLKFFAQIRFFLRRGSITFIEAMHI